MVDLIIPEVNIKVCDLELESIHNAIGGKIMVKALPDFPPIDCTQDEDCYEMAEHAVIMLSENSTDILICTLCKYHKDELLDNKQLLVPIQIVN